MEILAPQGALAAEILAHPLGNSEFHPFGVFIEEERIDFIADAITILVVKAISGTIVVVTGEVAGSGISGCGVVVAG